MAVLHMLLEVTIYSGILFFVILLFRAVFKKHASPAMLYAAWLLLALRLVIPVTVSGFSLIVLPAQPAQEAAAQEPQSGSLEPMEHTDGEASISPRTPAASVEDPAVGSAVTQGDTAAERTAVAVTRDAPWKWDWNTALITLWISGTAIVLLNTAAARAMLRKRLVSASYLPDGWHEAALRIQNELGIRRCVRIVAVRDFDSPALNASLRPAIIIPIELLRQNGQSVEFALRHELTHLKRKDHIVCLLLMLLKAIYWFNPVVWLASRLMKMDMETACDSRVVSAMDNTEKKQYASTILNMYTRAKPGYVLGMALGHTRQTAERRVRGIFMRRRSARGVNAAALLLAAVMLVACFTTALQPVRAAGTGSIEIESQEQTEPEIVPLTESTTPNPVTTPAPMKTYMPEPAASPVLSVLQKRNQLVSGNISACTFTFAVRNDGTVVQAGQSKDFGIYDTSKWSDIVAISSACQLLIGLRSNGTVVATGNMYLSMSDSVKEWKNIAAVAAGGNDTIMGLKSDGTVVSVGITYDSSDPNKVKNWRDIVAIAAGENFGVGLRSDGTVVATGENSDGQCNVGDWKDIVAIAASERNVVGLKSDGTIEATGRNYTVLSWRDIIAVACGGYCIVGLKADGTVVAAGDNYLGQCNTQNWENIIAISAGSGHTVGLKSDGTMVATGYNENGECEVEDWTNIATERLK